MKKLKGQLTISRVQSNQSRDYIEIELRDEMSGIQFLEIEITLETLMLALTGLALVDCEFMLGGLQNVGKRREMKVETVLVHAQHPKYEDVMMAVSAHEVDGWQCNLSQYSRILGSNWDGSTISVDVSFVRWVDAD